MSVGSAPHALFVDDVQIEQVLLNLLKNAIEAVSREEPERRRIHVQIGDGNDRFVEVAVSDQGPGVSADAVDKGV